MQKQCRKQFFGTRLVKTAPADIFGIEGNKRAAVIGVGAVVSDNLLERGLLAVYQPKQFLRVREMPE